MDEKAQNLIGNVSSLLPLIVNNTLNVLMAARCSNDLCLISTISSVAKPACCAAIMQQWFVSVTAASAAAPP